MKKNKSLSRLGIFLILAAVISFCMFYISVMMSNQGYSYIDVDTMKLVQKEEIQEGAPIAIIDTTLGEIRVVLYPEYAPETVKNFTELAESGFYDNTVVFEAKKGVYFAAGSGDILGNHKAEIRENQEHTPRELSQDLWPFRGALLALNTSVEGGVFDRFFKNETYYSGSRFMLLNSIDFTDEEFLAEFREASGNEELADAFINSGGVPNYSQQLAVFGQTYEGFDVIEAICNAELLEQPNVSGNTPPKQDILINTITISTYNTPGVPPVASWSCPGSISSD